MNIDKAWEMVGYYYVEKVDAAGREQNPHDCDFCNTVIRHVFVVECPDDGDRAEIGSECCKKHTAIAGVDEIDRDVRTREGRRQAFVDGPAWAPCRTGHRRKLNKWVYLCSTGKFGGYRVSYLPPDGTWQSVPGFHETVALARAALFDAAHPPLVPTIQNVSRYPD